MEENSASTSTKKSFPAVMVVILLLLFGAGAYFFMQKNSGSSQSQEFPESTMMENQDNGTSPAGDGLMEKTEDVSTATGASGDDSMSEAAVTVQVEGGMFYFKPNSITVKVGQPVKIVFKSADGFHDFVIDEFNAKTKQISTGETTEVTFTPNQTGSFEFYCSVGQHRQNGMFGTLIVQ